jgi:hypothetical protein
MAVDPVRLFLPVIGLVSNVIFQVCVFRCKKRAGLLASVISGFIAGIFVLSILELLFSDRSWYFMPVDTIIYSALGYCYFHFINMGETARRIRILLELSVAKEGLTLAELLERYNAGEIIDKRLARLVNSGQIILKNGRYYEGKPVMKLISGLMGALKLIVLGKR